MIQALQIVTILLAAIALTPALAHALEFPGKLRLGKEHYLAVQPIYYPGFTFAGFAEILVIVAALALAIMTLAGTARWLTLGALIAFVAMHATYWLLTHPVNNFWLKDSDLKGAGRGFFALGADRSGAPDWTALRDRWEYSHVVRAALASIGFTLLVVAATIT